MSPSPSKVAQMRRLHSLESDYGVTAEFNARRGSSSECSPWWLDGSAVMEACSERSRGICPTRHMNTSELAGDTRARRIWLDSYIPIPRLLAEPNDIICRTPFPIRTRRGNLNLPTNQHMGDKLSPPTIYNSSSDI